MKILVVGDWHSQVHEEAVTQALLSLGHEVVGFPWHRYFIPRTGALRPVDLFLKKAQNKFLVGPLMRRLNRDLIALFRKEKPDAVFVYRGTHIFPKTLQRMKALYPASVLIGYNNDDPFSPTQPKWAWRHFVSSIPCYDLVLAYRKHNMQEYQALGAPRVELLRSWFIPDKNQPVHLDASDREKFECDVVFAGHYENDGREKFLEGIVERGWKFRLFGPNHDWDPVTATSATLSKYQPVLPVWGADYNKALCGSKIALCFLSKLNRDTYTRRCFEIPATGTLMLSEYTDDLAGLYVEGKEADFFRSKDEMLQKIEYYLTHESEREAVAKAGRQRVLTEGHDVISRMKQVIAWVQECKTNEIKKEISGDFR